MKLEICWWRYFQTLLTSRKQVKSVSTTRHHKSDRNKFLPLVEQHHLLMPMHDNWEPRALRFALPSQQLLSHTCAYCLCNKYQEFRFELLSEEEIKTNFTHEFPFHRKSQTLRQSFHRSWWTPEDASCERSNRWLLKFYDKNEVVKLTRSSNLLISWITPMIWPKEFLMAMHKMDLCLNVVFSSTLGSNRGSS